MILNSRSLASSGGPCLKLLSPNNRYTTRKPNILAVSDPHCIITELSCLNAFFTMTSFDSSPLFRLGYPITKEGLLELCCFQGGGVDFETPGRDVFVVVDETPVVTLTVVVVDIVENVVEFAVVEADVPVEVEVEGVDDEVVLVLVVDVAVFTAGTDSDSETSSRSSLTTVATPTGSLGVLQLNSSGWML